MRYEELPRSALADRSARLLLLVALAAATLILAAPRAPAQDIGIGADIGLGGLEADIGAGIGGVGGSGGIGADASAGAGIGGGATGNAGVGIGGNGTGGGGAGGFAATADVSFGGAILGIGPAAGASASLGVSGSTAGATRGLSIGDTPTGPAASIGVSGATASSVAAAVGTLSPRERLRLKKTFAQVLADPSAADPTTVALCRLVVAAN